MMSKEQDDLRLSSSYTTCEEISLDEARRRYPYVADAPPLVNLDRVFLIALTVHGKQRDKAGEPYLWHVFRVAMQMDNDYDRAAALLHDVIEDSPMDRWQHLFTEIELLLGHDMAETIAALTRNPAEEYMAYIRRLALNRLAVKVKLYDLLDNARYERLEKLPQDEADRLRAKYGEAYKYLLDERAARGWWK